MKGMLKEDKGLNVVQSGVRTHLRYGFFHFVRRFWKTRNIGGIGRGVYVDRNVRFLRYAQNISLGEKVVLKEGGRLCSAQPDARIEIGAWTTIGYHVFIFASASISVGRDCLIAPFCYIVDSNHGSIREEIIRKQPMNASPIVIGEDVWLGAYTTVLAGVTIGRGAVIGTGSIVNTDIPEYAIAVGSPVQIKGYRQ